MKRVKINRKYYKIRFQKPPLLNDNNCRGYFSYDDQEIVLRRGMSPKEIFETFIHEILHGIEEEFGVPIPHRLIHDLEGPLAKVIKDNFNGKLK